MIMTEIIRAVFKNQRISAGMRIKTAKRQMHAEEPGLHCKNHLNTENLIYRTRPYEFKISTGARSCSSYLTLNSAHKNTQSRRKQSWVAAWDEERIGTDTEQECVRGWKRTMTRGSILISSIEGRQENQKADEEFLDIADYDYVRKVPPFLHSLKFLSHLLLSFAAEASVHHFSRKRYLKPVKYCLILFQQ